MKKMKMRSLVKLLEMVGAVEPVAVRQHVAAIVWWDFYSERHGLGAFLKLYDLSRGFDFEAVADVDALVAGLKKVGYSAAVAVRRVRILRRYEKRRAARMI